MELNQIDIHYLIAAICVISSALVFYTIGVWGERLQRKLKFWHIIFFLLGLLADTVGTSGRHGGYKPDGAYCRTYSSA